MKRLIAAMIALLFVTLGIMAHELEEKQEIKRTLKFQGTGGPRAVLVDNIRGPIDVQGYDGEDVELVVHRTNFADSNDKLAEAKEKVILDIKEEKDRILLYVDAPWRTSEGINYRGWRYYGYDVECSFELKVPKGCNLYVKTVNDGDITIRNAGVDFEVQNVNGAIDIENIAGAGKACTVNGHVRVIFGKNPQKECAFKTVNGKVEVEFPNDLSADLKLKTFNGNVYTDFDVTSLPRKMATSELHGSRRIYMRDKSFAVRVGNGGPELTFDTLNGNIEILKKEN